MTRYSWSSARDSRGFTLLEMLVVMVLLGIATLIATGGAESILRTSKERSWIYRLQAELVKARSYSRTSGIVAVVSFLPEEGEIRFARGSQVSRLPLPAGFHLDSDSDSSIERPTLLFFPDGTASEMEIVFTGGASATTRLRVAGVTGKIEVSRMEPPG